MPPLRNLSGIDLVKIFCNKLGFAITERKGSHVRLSKFTDSGKVGTTIPPYSELKIGTIKNILKLAQVDETEFTKYL